MINSHLLLGVIMNQICSYILSSLIWFLLLMSVILILIRSNMLHRGIEL
jgi:hypothetical protein